jgi:hypothetical protein
MKGRRALPTASGSNRAKTPRQRLTPTLIKKLMSINKPFYFKPLLKT